MYFARVLALTGAMLAGCGPSLGQAQSTAETITRWGLLGSWAVDCNLSLNDKRYSHLGYEIRQGKAVHVRNFGKDAGDASNISNAKIAPDGSLEIRIEYGGSIGTRDLTFIRGPDQRIRVKFHRKSDGEYVIFDGKFVANSATVNWQTRCR